MAYFGFTNKLLAGKTIQIYNDGNCRQDFTYVDDIVEGIVRIMAKAPAKTPDQTGATVMPDPDRASVPYAVYNIGGGQPEESAGLRPNPPGRTPRCRCPAARQRLRGLVPMQPGDVPTTYADSTALERDFGFTPRITLREFAQWYKEYYW